MTRAVLIEGSLPGRVLWEVGTGLYRVETASGETVTLPAVLLTEVRSRRRIFHGNRTLADSLIPSEEKRRRQR